LRRTVGIAAQLADGLTKAHGAGIVHRDLKPENIMITKDGNCKILDFGLSKLTSSSDAQLSTVQTQSSPGLILGTAGYMSPEQASGHPVDFHSDQFSFGLILYELITGKRAFQCKTVAETLSAIIKDEPESVASLNSQTPSPLRWIIERCLAKDPQDRYVSTRDLARDLQSIRDHFSEMNASSSETVAAVSAPVRSSRWPVYLAILLAGIVAGAFLHSFFSKPASLELPTLRYLTYSGEDTWLSASPDGRFIAFTSSRDGTPRIWIKEIAGGGELALTSGVDFFPRFSPDGSSIFFTHFGDEKPSLYRVSVLGGEPRKVIEDAYWSDWSPDGKKIVFIRSRTENQVQTSYVYIASVDGGELHEIAHFDNEQLTTPRWSPDGSRIAIAQAAGNANSIVLLVSPDGKTIKKLPLGEAARLTGIAWNGNGKDILCLEKIVAASIRETSGRAVLRNIDSGKSRTLFQSLTLGFSVDILSPGRIVFQSLSSSENLKEISIRNNSPDQKGKGWVTRGSSIDRQPAYSPDGEWVIFSSTRGGNLDVWKVSIKTGALIRLTEDSADDYDPAFTPDGKSILWSSRRSGNFEIWMANADGSNARQVSKDGFDAENPTMTRDGKWIVYTSYKPETRGIWKIHPDGSEPTRFFSGSGDLPEVSPDGQYVVYRIRLQEIGRIRVVRLADGAPVPFEIFAGREAAGRARWMPDGKALAFIEMDEEGRFGISFQDFLPGKDTTASRRRLSGLDPDLNIQTLGVSPDGSRIAIFILENKSNLMLAENVPGVLPPFRK
jgi:eukaryotic-like serine/threonine-protein kinase